MGKRYSELLYIADWLDFIVGSWLCIDTASGAKKIPAEMLSSLKHLQVESNEEFLYVISDSEGVFLFGIRQDGSMDWAKGIPKPVRDMFSRVFEILETKVDKEAGKSLINKTFSDGISVVSNDEFLYAISDSEGTFLFGIKRDGNIEWSKGVPGPIREVLNGILENKVDKEEGKSLVNEVFASGVSIVSNEEFLFAIVDENDSLLGGFKRDGGVAWLKGIPDPIRKSLQDILNVVSTKVDKEIGKSLINQTFADGVSLVSNDEYLFAALDSNSAFLFGVKRDGRFDWAKGMSQELRVKLESIFGSLESLEECKVDKESGKSLINEVFADGISVVSNDEFLYAVSDSEGRFLFGIKRDGSIEWSDGIPGPIRRVLNEILETKVDKEEGKGLINRTFADGISIVSNEEFLFALVDSGDRVVFGAKRDGGFYWSKGLPSVIKEALAGKVNKVNGKSLIDAVVAACFNSTTNPEFIGATVDKLGRLLEGIRPDGSREFFTKIKPMGGVDWSGDASIKELSIKLKESGFSSGQGDWSDAEELAIPQPYCAVVNVIAPALPTTKTDDIEGYLEFNDRGGNFFRKKIVINAQGAGSMKYPKKNFSIDLLNEDGSEFKLKIGKWVWQDSFHLKAFYTTFLKAEPCVTYDIFDEYQKSRGIWHDVPWKTALINRDDVVTGFGLGWNAEDDLELRMDTGAINHPLGFPCLLYFNGQFYGIYVFQLKKNRKNYHMTKSNHKEIHLDGKIDENNLLGGTIDWTEFEVRNPGSLKNMDGTKYDGDNPQEIKACEAKTYIQNLSNVGPALAAAVNTYGVNSDEVKTLFETHYDVDNVIDYIIFIETIFDPDSMNNNWQWTTYDGVKWFLNPYDLDTVFGKQAGQILPHRNYHYRNGVKELPVYYIYNRTDYLTRLELRYKYLRDTGVCSVENFMRHIDNFVQAVGINAYKAEYERWHGSVSSSNLLVNSDYWEIVTTPDGEPVEGLSETWDSTAEYVVGDEVSHCIYESNGFYTFRCINPNSNQDPVKEWRLRDSYWRIAKWMEEQFVLNDALYHYT